MATSPIVRMDQHGRKPRRQMFMRRHGCGTKGRRSAEDPGIERHQGERYLIALTTLEDVSPSIPGSLGTVVRLPLPNEPSFEVRKDLGMIHEQLYRHFPTRHVRSKALGR